MAEVKPEEASEGALRDPTEAEETGNTKAKTQMGNSTIRISSHLADAVEANNARTKAKMEVIPEVNKTRGDTIEEGLQEAIDAAGSSKKIWRGGKDLHAIRRMTHNLPQHADCATEPKIDPIWCRCKRHTPQGRRYSIKAEVKMGVTCQPLPW
uniref:Uncharacterized protein n=1 Tax=Romanomermis culicivorax TaxID=13658 RepID=A0A915HFH1_ROMCU